MRPARLLALAIAGEAVLVLVAVVWMGLRDIPIRLGAGGWPRGVVIGGLAAGGLAIVKLYLLCRAPAVPGVPAVCRLYRDTLRPLFGAIGLRDVVVISVAAGVGEELLFRGAVQPELGLVPASIIFGVLHMGGRGTVAFGCWVAVMGVCLGGSPCGPRGCSHRSSRTPPTTRPRWPISDGVPTARRWDGPVNRSGH